MNCAPRAALLCGCWLSALLLALPAGGNEAGSVSLIDQDGRDFRLDTLHGQVVLLVFGFTHCPHICPVEMARMSAALSELEASGDEVSGVFITVDPGRDTPAVIKSYIEKFHPGIVGLTGAADALDTVADYYRVRRNEQQLEEGDYLIDHGYSLYLLDPQGEAQVAVLPGLPPAHIVSLARELLQK